MKLSYLKVIILTCVHLRCMLSLHLSMTQKPVTKVIITGASNSVGLSVFKKLLKKKSFYPIALVRSKKGYNALLKLGADPTQVKIFDICNKETLTGDLFEGATKAVLCTSSKPKKRFRFIIKDFFRKITFRKQNPPNGTDFYYPDKQSPYDIDYIGQRNVIDACVNAKIEHIVMLGSMGGYRGGKQNEIGRKTEDDSKKGNILKWKLAAERYLMKRSFFTIIHAGTLTDEPGGQREIVWDTDDALLRTDFRKIPEEDVAEVLVQSLMWKEAIGRSIDVGSLNPGEGLGPTKDWLRFWARSGNCIYPADDSDL